MHFPSPRNINKHTSPKTCFFNPVYLDSNGCSSTNFHLNLMILVSLESWESALQLCKRSWAARTFLRAAIVDFMKIFIIKIDTLRYVFNYSSAIFHPIMAIDISFCRAAFQLSNVWSTISQNLFFVEICLEN